MDYYELISEAIISGETGKVVKYIKEAVSLKYPSEHILKYGLIKGVNVISNKFKYEDVLIPEVLMSTRALHAGLRALQPYIQSKDKKKRVKIVMGTVYGDLHDIGKNIVKILLTTLNVEIIDLGVDVSMENFVEAVEREKPDLLMMSSLLTTTMNEMKLVIKELEKRGLREKVIIFIGGGPIREAFRKQIGADYYIEEAIELRDYIKNNLDKFSKNQKEKNKKEK